MEQIPTQTQSDAGDVDRGEAGNIPAAEMVSDQELAENEYADAEAASQENKEASLGEIADAQQEVSQSVEQLPEEAESAREMRETADQDRMSEVRASLTADAAFAVPVIAAVGSRKSEAFEEKYKLCERCRGSGKRFFIFKCNICNGAGRVVASRRVERSR